MTNVLPIPTYLIADDTVGEIIERLSRARPFILEAGIAESDLDLFVAAVFKADHGSSRDQPDSAGSGNGWTVTVAENRLYAECTSGFLRIVATTDDTRIIELAKECAPVVISLDVDWRDVRDRGLQVAGSLLNIPEIADRMMILLKTTVEGEAAAAFLRNKRKPLPLRNPFFGEMVRFNIQLIETTHDERRGQSRQSLEEERLRYAFLALTESLLFQRSFSHGSARAARADLKTFSDTLHYYHCFSENAHRHYRTHLSRCYGYAHGFPVPTRNDSDDAVRNGLDTTLAYSVLGDTNIGALRYKLSKLSGGTKIKESLAIIRMLLRYERVHQLEIFLPLLPLVKSDGGQPLELRPFEKKDFQGKWNKTKMENFGPDSTFVSLPDLTRALGRLKDLAPPDSELLREIETLSRMLNPEKGAAAFDYEKYESGLTALRGLITRSLPYYQADQIAGELDRLEAQIAPRDGLLLFERGFAAASLRNGNVPFAEKVVSLLRWQQVLHPSAFARKLMARRATDGSVTVDVLIEALSIDCACSPATRAVQQLDDTAFADFAERAENTLLRTGLPDNADSLTSEQFKQFGIDAQKRFERGEIDAKTRDAVVAGEKTIPLLAQFAWTVFIDEWRLSVFCDGWNRNAGELTKKERERATEVLGEVWHERDWTTLYSPTENPEWRRCPLAGQWQPEGTLAARLRKSVDHVWEAFKAFRDQLPLGEIPAWVHGGWTGLADLSWMQDMGLANRIRMVTPPTDHAGADGVTASEQPLGADADAFARLAETLLEKDLDALKDVLARAFGDKPHIIDALLAQFSAFAHDQERLDEAVELLRLVETRETDAVAALFAILSLNEFAG